MADSEPTLMSGATAQQQQQQSAIEMKQIDGQPSVPAKDGDPESSSAKGKDKEAGATRGEQTDSLSIGAADSPADAPTNPADGPVCNITLLLPTGARHPYKIDDRYLTKRNVDVPDITEHGKKDPFSISVYKLKELILREWRDEWDNKPASPSSIRLIHFGKLLEDKEQLSSKCSSTLFPRSQRCCVCGTSANVTVL